PDWAITTTDDLTHRPFFIERGSTVRVRQRACKIPAHGDFPFRRTCSSSHVRWVWSRLWSFRARDRPLLRQEGVEGVEELRSRSRALAWWAHRLRAMPT